MKEYNSLEIKGLMASFKAHRARAKRYGIGFEFSFEEWVEVWEDSGHLYEMGRYLGQYCMSRFRDKGPYARNNVEIKLSSENSKEVKHRPQNGEENGQAKLTTKQVSEIRRLWAKGNISQHTLARKFNISAATICNIIKRHSWKHIP